MKRTLVLGLENKKEIELIMYAAHLLACMTGNPNFPDPIPSIGELQASADSYNAALADWEPGDKRKTIYKNEMRVALKDRIKRISSYVTWISGDDQDMILSSGFSLSKEPEAHPIPGPPIIKTLKDGNYSGTVKINMLSVGKRLTYCIAYREKGTEAWRYHVSITPRNIQIDELMAGEYHEFKVSASNAAGTSSWSNVLKFLVR